MDTFEGAFDIKIVDAAAIQDGLLVVAGKHQLAKQLKAADQIIRVIPVFFGAVTRDEIQRHAAPHRLPGGYESRRQLIEPISVPLYPTPDPYRGIDGDLSRFASTEARIPMV